jgi:protein arginine kinase activator
LICDECKKRPTKVHITHIVNGHKTKLSLCEECAQKYQKKIPNMADANFAVHKFLAGLLDEELDMGVSPRVKPETTCPGCGLTYADFSAHGRLGCGECYNAFQNKIDPLLVKIHRRNVHAGKFPQAVSGEEFTEEAHTHKELERLRSELQMLVDEERFEEAATTRDRIRELESQIEGTS